MATKRTQRNATRYGGKLAPLLSILTILFVFQYLSLTALHAPGAHAAEPVDSQSTNSQPANTPEITADQKAFFHYQRGTYYLWRWKFPLAEIEFDEAVADKPDLIAAHRQLCVLELLQGIPQRALAEFMVVVGMAEPVPYSLDEKLQMNERACKLHYEVGLELAGNHRWEKALSEFQAALNYSPDNTRVIRSEAFALGTIGDLDRADALYQKSFTLDPKDAFAHADLADLLFAKGEHTRAEFEMVTAVKLAPNAAALHVDLGWMAEAKGDLSTASGEFQKAVEISPRHAFLWMHLGRLLEAQGKHQAAHNAYSQAQLLSSR